MKKKLCAYLLPLVAACLVVCSCEIKDMSGIKSLTRPYINEYVCTYGMLGERDLLEETEYIKVTFIDKQTIEISYKKTEGKRHAFECGYTYDDDTGEIIIDFGLFGAENKPRILIKDGKFTVLKQLAAKLLVMVFEVK